MRTMRSWTSIGQSRILIRSHHGVLFLDELDEFDGATLHALRHAGSAHLTPSSLRPDGRDRSLARLVASAV